MGNAVLWKPSDTAVLSNWVIFEVMKEASNGLLESVVVSSFLSMTLQKLDTNICSQNFIPADGPVFGDAITASPYLSGINFTGSVP